MFPDERAKLELRLEAYRKRHRDITEELKRKESEGKAKSLVGELINLDLMIRGVREQLRLV